MTKNIFMKNVCNNCKTVINSHDQVYRAQDTRLNLSIFVCKKCSLVQSYPKIDKSLDREVKVSSGADWGNIRYGKSFRSEFAISMIKELCNISKFYNVLDVGSNRGSFLKKFHEENESANLVGIEPDSKLKEDYTSNLFIKLINDRVENVKLENSLFDLVHCSHTLEHLSDPVSTLSQIKKSMKPDGLLFVEVPNLFCIDNKKNFEEFFIDKHLYHYTEKTIQHTLSIVGFEILKKSVDNINLSYLVSPKKPSDMKEIFENHESVKLIRKKIIDYANNMHQAKKSYIKASRSIIKHLPKKIVIWGGGRIFDLLFKHGEIKISDICGLIDKNLYKYVNTVRGIPIKSPEYLSEIKPDVVIIASRVYFDEIKKYILDNSDWPIEIYGLMDLLD